jgi:hypothetical protein
MVEMHKPPNFKVIDDDLRWSTGFSSALSPPTAGFGQLQPNVCYQVKRRPDLFTPDSLQHVNQKVG